MLAYAYLGSSQINVFLQQAGTLPAPILSLIAFGFLAAASAKSAQVPFQTWLPDAMEAPTPISALIHAATMVNAGVYLLARFYPAFAGVPAWKTAVMVVGLLSALLAALMALFSNDLKRTLAYSTISQLGYMVYALGIGATFASQFHLMSHSVFKALLFLAAGAVIHTAGTRDMFKMGGLSREMPFVRTVFLIGALGLVGLPLTNGFFSKELILESGLEHGPGWAYAGMLLAAGLTGLYSLRMVSLVFYGPQRLAGPLHDATGAMRFSLAILAYGVVFLWLAAGAFSQLLAQNLVGQSLHAETTIALVQEVILALPTWLTIGFVLLVMSLWFLQKKLRLPAEMAAPLVNSIRAGYGFEWINRQVIRLTGATAAALQNTQTGLLGWNVAAIGGGLILLLILIRWGG